MRSRYIFPYLLLGVCGFALSCGQNVQQKGNDIPQSIGDAPAVRLNYRYEADVPPPVLEDERRSDAERNTSVQADFDNARPQELLDRTITSPDKKRVVAVYRNAADQPSDVRLDMYSSEGKLLHKVTSDAMAGRFPDTILWSPDSKSLAFVAVNRTIGLNTQLPSTPAPTPPDPNLPDTGETPTPTPERAPTPAAPTGILTFRTEQIYICDADGAGVRPVTQNEGLIYFYFVWSPNNSMLAAVASTAREWRYQEIVSEGKGEIMVPQGRLRTVEKNGRERRLDDNLTAVHPVWSPDSAKVAVSYDAQIRIYDAGGTNPTQAAIPLKNQLLISSQAYDRDQQRKLQSSNSGGEGNAPMPTPSSPEQASSTLPDEKLLVSYNPIVRLAWTADDILYLETAYEKRMKNDPEVTSFARWHRLILTPQPAGTAK